MESISLIATTTNESAGLILVGIKRHVCCFTVIL